MTEKKDAPGEDQGQEVNCSDVNELYHNSPTAANPPEDPTDLKQNVIYGLALGWRFTPLNGKRPVRSEWQKEAPIDPVHVLRCAEQGNMGLRTGSVSSVLVIDLDEGAPSPDELGLPSTVQVETGGGGTHLYFRIPDGETFGNSAGRIAPHVDTRGDGGQVVFPGSIHPGTGALYEWAAGHEPWNMPMAELPAHIIEALSKSKPSENVLPFPERHNTTRESAYVAKAIAGEAETVRGAPEGQRNSTLNTASFKLAGLGVSLDEITGALLPAAMAAGLPEAEARKTIESGWKNGKDKPRAVPPPLPIDKGVPFGWDVTDIQFPREYMETSAAPEFLPPAEAVPDAPTAAPAADMPPIASARPAPTPLPDGLLPVLPFDEQWLPDTLRPWVVDIAAQCQCPLDYPAAATLVALSAAVGKRCAIRPKYRGNWLVVANLWGAIVGRPGTMKSPALQSAMAPLHALEDKAREKYAAECRAANAELSLSSVRAKLAKNKIEKALKNGDEDEARRLAIEGQAEPDMPVRMRMVANDATVEKLGELLADNPNGLLMFRDELTGFLKRLDDENQQCARAFFLEAWSGSSRFTYDRIGRGTVEIESAVVSILGGIQPGPLTAYLARCMKDQENDGLIQRLQVLVWPDGPTGAWKDLDVSPNKAAYCKSMEVFEALSELDGSALGAEVDQNSNIPYLRFCGEAQEAFSAWHMDLENHVRQTNLRRSEDPDEVLAHLSKYRSLCPSIALLLHLADGELGPVSLEATQTAIEWCKYLESHARRMYAAGRGEDCSGAKALLGHRGDLPEWWEARTVYRKQWGMLDNKDRVLQAIAVLDGFGWIDARPVPPGAAGGPKTTQYRLRE